MRHLNAALEDLKHCLPRDLQATLLQSDKKLTKIKTLRLAISYIRMLSTALLQAERAEQ